MFRKKQKCKYMKRALLGNQIGFNLKLKRRGAAPVVLQQLYSGTAQAPPQGPLALVWQHAISTQNSESIVDQKPQNMRPQVLQ